jgi:hypothetical protein
MAPGPAAASGSEIQPEFRSPHCVNRIERGHPVIALVPAFVPLARINTQQHIWANSPDDGRGLLSKLGLRSIFQHAVVVNHPHDVFFRRAQQSLGTSCSARRIRARR